MKESDSFSRETSLSFQDGGIEILQRTNTRTAGKRSDDGKRRFLDNGSENKRRRNSNTWDRKTKSMYDTPAFKRLKLQGLYTQVTKMANG